MNALSDHFAAQLQPVHATATDAPPWWVARRQKAASHFAAAGFPDPRHEEWKYTNVRSIANRPLVLSEGTDSFSAEAVHALALPGLEAYRIVLVNGFFRPEWSDLEGLPEGSVRSLADALHHVPEQLEPRFATLAHDRFSSFVAANTALTAGGVLIQLPSGLRLEKPLYLLHVATATESPSWHHPRVLIHGADTAEATIIEHYRGCEGANGCTNVVTEIQAESGAQLEHYILQENEGTAYHIGSIFIHQKRDSSVQSFNINLGSRLSRYDINVDLAEPGARVGLQGLFLAGGRQHLDTHTRVHHLAPHTTSVEQYRGIAQGHGRGVFKGRVLVEEGAQKTDAQQHSANLLLSPHAEIDTKPELEIYADDVRCAHGATVGQLDETSLYYLRSRGISAAAARALLVSAFAEVVLESLQVDAVRTHVEQQLAVRLPEAIREGM